MSPEIATWWTFLRAVSVLNVALWIGALVLARREGAGLDPASRQLQRRLLALALLFTVGCGFRSFYPRADVQRFVLVDSWLSSVAIGRSVATVAELSFVAAFALILGALARSAGARGAGVVARLAVPVIAVAEVSSWTAVVTTCYLGNVIEESLWATTFAAIGVAALSLRPRLEGAARTAVTIGAAGTAAYVAFMSLVDVPMYFTRWRADTAAGRVYFSLADGFTDVATRWRATGDISDWGGERAWMALYFSFAVWMVLLLTRAPRLVARATARS
jgi:hypothetical protein